MNFLTFAIRFLAAALLATSALFSLSAHASVVIAGTRVVYNAADSEVTLKLTNIGKNPALTQVWLDKGDASVDPSRLDLPFLLAPAIARIEPGKSQTIRISYTGEPLAQDRETLLWLNMLEVPPKPVAAQAGANYVQLAFRSRLKFFFRPAGLAGDANDAPGKLTWRLVTEQGKSVLRVSNPTPYHVTIIEAHIGAGDHAPKFDEGDMVAPHGQVSLPLTGMAPADGKVSFTTLNDYGGAMKYEAALQ